MALSQNINNMNNMVHFGSRGDICVLCKREIAAESPQQSLAQIEHQLYGKLEGKEVFKTRHSGADLVICMDHIKQIHEQRMSNAEE